MKSNFIFPTWSGAGGKYSSTYLEDTSEILMALFKLPNNTHVNKAARELLSGIYQYLEKMEGFKYQLSEGFIKNIEGVEYGSCCNPDGTKFVIEHRVPMKVMRERIRSIDFKSNKDFIKYLKETYSLCLITREEDRLLNNAKLTSSMPKNGNCRYIEAGITLV